MKKLLATILALALSIPLATTASAAINVKNTTAFTLSGNADMLTTTRVTDEALIDDLEALLSASQKTSVKAQTTTAIASLALEQDSGATAKYNVLADSDGSLYIQSGSTLHEIEAADFYAITNALSQSLYRYQPIPAATITVNGYPQAVPVSESSYSYKKLNGKFYRPQPDTTTAMDISALTDGLFIPTITPKPASVTIKVSKDGTEYFSGDTAKAGEFRPTQPGTYTVTTTATFANTYYKGTVSYRYTFAHRTDTMFAVEGNSTNPGEVVILRAQNVPAGQTIAVQTDLGFTPSFFDDGKGGKLALLPVSVFTQLGQHYIQLTCGTVTQKFAITANYKKFDIQYLTVSESTTQETINSNDANAEYNRIINPLKPVSDPVQRWEGRFILPVSDNRVTTTFGMIRYTNGSKDGNVHGAVDLAVPTGTPVAASNSGRVLYAGLLKLTGNTVIIEHGYGLKTWYYHMDTLTVKTNDLLAKGQQIGTVGTTGFSTGPHLHFGMTVNNLSINPYTAINTDILTFDKQ